jgi:nicotinate-nucleotide pyrophosphorylase (carboxylating)
MKALEKNIKETIKAALREDIGREDVSTAYFVPVTKKFNAIIKAKEPLILCGVEVAIKTFKALDPYCKVITYKSDGQSLKKGDVILKVSGTRSMLSAERTALNFLQRLSGIATITHKFVKKTKGAKSKIFDTRKTTPGLRLLEKYAVTCGGGKNHRFGLSDAIMIKDNHIKASNWQTIAKTVAKFKNSKSVKFVEIEVKTLEELKKALKCKPDIILLDNMSVSLLKKCIKLVSSISKVERPQLEISGGVNLKNVSKFAKLNLDRISVGQITHSAKSVDIGMDIKNEK